jgi:hypothetical protein
MWKTSIDTPVGRTCGPQQLLFLTVFVNVGANVAGSPGAPLPCIVSNQQHLRSSHVSRRVSGERAVWLRSVGYPFGPLVGGGQSMDTQVTRNEPEAT